MQKIHFDIVSNTSDQPAAQNATPPPGQGSGDGEAFSRAELSLEAALSLINPLVSLLAADHQIINPDPIFPERHWQHDWDSYRTLTYQLNIPYLSPEDRRLQPLYALVCANGGVNPDLANPLKLTLLSGFGGYAPLLRLYSYFCVSIPLDTDVETCRKHIHFMLDFLLEFLLHADGDCPLREEDVAEHLNDAEDCHLSFPMVT